MPRIPRIEATEVRDRLRRGEPLVFVDARNPRAYSETDERLPGAIRVPPDMVDQHAAEIPKGRLVVAYCT